MTTSNKFREFYNDDANISPAERAKIEFEVELIGKLIAAQGTKDFMQQQLAEAADVNRCKNSRSGF